MVNHLKVTNFLENKLQLEFRITNSAKMFKKQVSLKGFKMSILMKVENKNLIFFSDFPSFSFYKPKVYVEETLIRFKTSFGYSTLESTRQFHEAYRRI